MVVLILYTRVLIGSILLYIIIRVGQESLYAHVVWYGVHYCAVFIYMY